MKDEDIISYGVFTGVSTILACGDIAYLWYGGLDLRHRDGFGFGWMMVLNFIWLGLVVAGIVCNILSKTTTIQLKKSWLSITISQLIVVLLTLATLKILHHFHIGI
jgi:lysylphosphatidylglycerol synthetase-like protein (DUF2156 family)